MSDPNTPNALPVNIQPTIGRIVWYKHSPDEKAQFYPGIICYVHSDDMVNLSASNESGEQSGLTSVPLHQGTPETCPVNSCCWMPYQKEQAAKA